MPVLPNGEYSDCVFLWDHETDSREWIAQSLKDFFYRISLEVEERYAGESVKMKKQNKS